MYENFEKTGNNLQPFGQALQKLCHAHLHFIGIICS